MIHEVKIRGEIARKLGQALDDLVRDRMKGLPEEPDITSRIGQRLEERFDGKVLEGYRVEVITETITSHGSTSLEKPMGTDLYLGVAVTDAQGNAIAKSVLIQAKRKDKLNRRELREQCRRMNLITKKGSVVWIYSPTGIDVIRSVDVEKGKWRREFAVRDLFDRVFECELGDRRRVPKGPFGDRKRLREMIETLGADNAVWLGLNRRRR